MIWRTRAEGALEAEELVVLRVTPDSGSPRPSAPREGVSAGRVLEWHAAGPNQGIVLRLDAERAGAYVLGVRPVYGPSGAIIQGFCGGEALGPALDLYAAETKPSASVVPLGQIPREAREIEVRAVGSNPAATGCEVELDYFRFEPLIIGPGTAEGVWAQVVETSHCQYRIQNLGGQWLGGHQLWVQPSTQGAYVDIGLQIPAEGDYEIVVRYTTSWDYAIVQASLDGSPLGTPTDCYSARVLLAEPVTLGRLHLTAGQHLVRFQAADKNPESRGYLMGIDYLTARQAR